MGWRGVARVVGAAGAGYGVGVGHAFWDTRVFAVVKERTWECGEQTLLVGTARGGAGCHAWEPWVHCEVRKRMADEFGSRWRSARGVYLRRWDSGLWYWMGGRPDDDERIN